MTPNKRRKRQKFAYRIFACKIIPFIIAMSSSSDIV